MTLILTSPAFAGAMPIRHARAGLDLSPPLSWDGAPEGTQAFALSVEDPDAPGGTFVHWLIWDLPARARALREGIAKARHLEDGAKQGINGYGAIGWGGPEPPPGETHRYVFTLVALSAPLALAAGAAAESYFAELQKKALTTASMIATFGR